MVGNTHCLLHVVRDDDDGVLLLELHRELFDLRCRNGVERTCRLVHQQHLGLDRECAGDAKALLLAAGEAERVFLQAVLDLVPNRRAAQGFFNDLIELCLVLHAVRARTVGNVIVNAHWEGVRLLEHHTHLTPKLAHIDGRVKNVLALIADAARDLHIGDQIVHAVERL